MILYLSKAYCDDHMRTTTCGEKKNQYNIFCSNKKIDEVYMNIIYGGTTFIR
jgi:hypothetical protein